MCQIDIFYFAGYSTHTIVIYIYLFISYRVHFKLKQCANQLRKRCNQTQDIESHILCCAQIINSILHITI